MINTQSADRAVSSFVDSSTQLRENEAEPDSNENKFSKARYKPGPSVPSQSAQTDKSVSSTIHTMMYIPYHKTVNSFLALPLSNLSTKREFNRFKPCTCTHTGKMASKTVPGEKNNFIVVTNCVHMLGIHIHFKENRIREIIISKKVHSFTIGSIVRLNRIAQIKCIRC